MAMPRKRPLEDRTHYYVYAWWLDEILIYIGYGKDNRARPDCMASWGGRCKDLIDVLYSRRHEVVWRVLPCESKEAAVALEKSMITLLRPKFNIVLGTGSAGAWTSERRRNAALAAMRRT